MPKLAFPKTLRIAAYDVKVEKWSNNESELCGCHGQWMASELKIMIHIDKNPIVTTDTLLHEIEHAICSLYHISEDDDEERSVTMKSSAWTQVYRDNPELLKWIGQALEQSNTGNASHS